VLEFLDPATFAAVGSIIIIDIVLSGDNAIVIGMAVAGLPAHLRKKAIIIGIFAATALRIMFAAITLELLQVIGLTLAGGILLLWVCWRMWREIRDTRAASLAEETHQEAEKRKQATNLRQALILIVVADVSMSLDNVLAVAGAAEDDERVLVFGLLLSIALMAVAANFIAKLLQKHHWIAYVGLGVIFYVAIDMIWRGSFEVMTATGMS
jgi:YjbE family integral membrane protein